MTDKPSAVETETVKTGRRYESHSRERRDTEERKVYQAAACTLRGYLSCKRHAVYWSGHPDNGLGEQCPFCVLARSFKMQGQRTYEEFPP